MTDQAPGPEATGAQDRKVDEGEAEKLQFTGSLRQVGWLFRQSLKDWAEDKSPKTAAALAYYSLFALGPLLLIAVSIAGLVFGNDAARDAVAKQVGKLVGDSGAEAIDGLMASGLTGRKGVAGIAVGIVMLLFGAAGAFAQLREGLNKTWEIEALTVKGFADKARLAVRRNLFSFAGVLGVGFLLLVGLGVSAALSAIAGRMEGVFPGGEVVMQLLSFLLSLTVTTLMFAAMFKFLPDARVAWRDTMVGGFFTGVLFVLGQLAIGLYLGQAATASRYGAAGAIPVVLLWLYYSSMILLFGAEVAQVYANRFGTSVHPNRHAQPIQDAVIEREDAPSKEGTESSPEGRHRRGGRTGRLARGRREERPAMADLRPR